MEPQSKVERNQILPSHLYNSTDLIEGRIWLSNLITGSNIQAGKNPALPSDAKSKNEYNQITSDLQSLRDK